MRRKQNQKVLVEGGNWWKSHYHLMVGGAVCLGFVAGLAFTWFCSPGRGKTGRLSLAATARADTLTPAITNEWETIENPWGEIICQNINLERPPEAIPELRGESFKINWFFGSMTASEVREVLRSCELPEASLRSLQNTNEWVTTTNGWRLSPNTNVVWSLDRQARSRLYAVLARYPENKFQATPFRFPVSREKEWLADGGLSAETVNIAHRLMYERGHCACFADVELLSMIPSEAERHLLLQCLTRQPAVLARLQLRPHADLTNIISYWEQAKPRKEILPLLSSLHHRPEGASVNLTFLLPPFARSRVYCYPDQVNDLVGEEDCLWSALNFCNAQPDHRLLDKNQRQAALKRDYVVINAEPTLGDILLMLDKDNMMVHACVYVADKLVFTKNGVDQVTPWVLMDIRDVLAYYYEFQPFKTVVLRQKGRVAPPWPCPVVPEIHQLVAMRH